MVLKSKKYIFIFLFPAMLLITIFLYYPLGKTVQYSFTDYSEWSPVFNYIGWENFHRLFTDSIIGKSLINTLILLVGCVVVEVGVALILAVLVDSIKRGFRFFRMVFFFPVVISGSAIGLMFYLAFQYDYGLMNNIIAVFGMEKINWITENSAMYLVLIPVLWQYVGFYFVIFLTAIANVPADIYESAELDGITGFKKTIYITIPMIQEVIVTSLGLVIAGSLKVFDIVFVMTNGGPLDASQLLSTYQYQQAFVYNNQGYGSAISVLIITLGLIIYIVTNKLAQQKEGLY
ncbi:carbohydrate ABC transporter permease [Ruminiclostridium cellobioparum]|uniref:ABC transporter, permease protein n=1 Tax=Ruminiclostridium cellobioparum subsp. termitidis CT1112 TaxID=1195236 RepID=S0FGY5_RUMCE|nr:sugar ABC transporter permease [Ruminiclostridium cellobioparum]EMS70860.1 ABC transporter, permease protein [Ruminiclostridium cellobioparum subsp. termitidis CT1112]